VVMKLVYRKYLKRAALIWSGCFLLLLAAYLTVMAPQEETSKQIERQLAEKKQICDAAQKAAQKETRAKLDQEVERLRDRLRQFVADHENSASLTFDINQIAAEKQVASFRIKGKDRYKDPQVPDGEHISENYMTVSFTASFNQFAAFLNALERHRPVVFVDTFSITPLKNDDSGHKVTMDLAVFVEKRADSGPDDETMKTI